MNRQAFGHGRQARFSAMPAGLILQRKCACGNHVHGNEECSACAAKQQNARRQGERESAIVPPIVLAALRAPGQPIDTATRAFMEPRLAGELMRVKASDSTVPPMQSSALAIGPAEDGFEQEADRAAERVAASTSSEFENRGEGRDFSRVRIHTGGVAAESARAIGARAYTVGGDIVFGAGQYAPHTDSGRQLLAHELAHTIQQGQGTPASIQRKDLGPERHGDTLPFVESKELADCIRIMGEENAESCREQVLGEKKPPSCPATHTIPDDVYAGIDAAWKKSKHGEASVTEHGGRIVSDKSGKRVIRTGSGGSGGMSMPAAKTGDTTLGSLHTHPYSTSEGSHLGVAFSGTDMTTFIGGTLGSVMYVGAGSCYFVLDTLNYSDRDSCKTVDVKKRWKDSFDKAAGTLQEKVEIAVKDVSVGCGICFYKTCRPDEKSPVPQTANLV